MPASFAKKYNLDKMPMVKVPENKVEIPRRVQNHIEHPRLSEPENLLASEDKMKELNANEDGKSLAFNGWGFQILLLTAQKILWGWSKFQWFSQSG